MVSIAIYSDIASCNGKTQDQCVKWCVAELEAIGYKLAQATFMNGSQNADYGWMVH